jgi:hypothetical protein
MYVACVPAAKPASFISSIIRFRNGDIIGSPFGLNWPSDRLGTRQTHRIPQQCDLRRCTTDYLGEAVSPTKGDYSLYLDRIRDTWGRLPVSGLSAPDIYALRKPYESTPVAANHLVSVLRTLLGFGIPRKYIDRNPALDVVAIEITNQQNARPWPEWAYKLTLELAPEHIRNV